MKIENLIIIEADEGYTFQRIADGVILGDKLSFNPIYDSAMNYAEIVKPPEPEIQP